MEFLFSCSTLYLTSKRRELVKYQVEHSKRNSISVRTYVLSLTYRKDVKSLVKRYQYHNLTN